MRALWRRSGVDETDTVLVVTISGASLKLECLPHDMGIPVKIRAAVDAASLVVSVRLAHVTALAPRDQTGLTWRNQLLLKGCAERPWTESCVVRVVSSPLPFRSIMRTTYVLLARGRKSRRKFILCGQRCQV